MDIARRIIVFIAAVTAIGGLSADWFIPAGARMHLKNPAWKPHAKFHNAQGILMGFGQGALGDRTAFRRTPLVARHALVWERRSSPPRSRRSIGTL